MNRGFVVYIRNKRPAFIAGLSEVFKIRHTLPIRESDFEALLYYSEMKQRPVTIPRAGIAVEPVKDSENFIVVACHTIDVPMFKSKRSIHRLRLEYNKRFGANEEESE